MDFMIIQNYLEKVPKLEEMNILPEVKDLLKKYGKLVVDEKVNKILDDRHFFITTAKTEATIKKLDFSMNYYLNSLLEELSQERERNVKKIINCLGTIYSEYIGAKIYSKELLKDFVDTYSTYNSLRYDLSKGKAVELSDEVGEILKTYSATSDYVLFSNFQGALYSILNSSYKNHEIISSVRESYTFSNGLDINNILESVNIHKKLIGSLNKLSIEDYKKSINEKSVIVLSDFYGNSMDGLAKLKEEELKDLLLTEKTIFVSDKIYLSNKNEEVTKYGIELKSLMNDKSLIIADLSKLEDLPNCALVVGNKELIKSLKESFYLKLFTPAKEIETLFYLGLDKKINENKENSYVDTVLLNDEIKIKKRNVKFVEELQKGLGTSCDIGLMEGPYLKIEEGVSYNDSLNRELVVITPKKIVIEEIEVKLRNSEPAVLCWMNEGSILINLQLVDKKDEKVLLEVLIDAIKK